MRDHIVISYDKNNKRTISRTMTKTNAVKRHKQLVADKQDAVVCTLDFMANNIPSSCWNNQIRIYDYQSD